MSTVTVVVHVSVGVAFRMRPPSKRRANTCGLPYMRSTTARLVVFDPSSIMRFGRFLSVPFWHGFWVLAKA